jgi:hypothetical protein
MNEYLFDRYLKEIGVRDWEADDKDRDSEHVALAYTSNDVNLGTEMYDDLAAAGSSGMSYKDFAAKYDYDMFFKVSSEAFTDAFAHASNIVDKDIDWESLEQNSSLFYERLNEVGDSY